MDPVIAALLGALAGAALIVLAVRLRRRGSAAPAAPTTAPPPGEVPVPDGVGDVLAVLRAGAIVVDRSARVRLASASVAPFGLVRGDMLVRPELRELVEAVHRDGMVRERELEIARGPIGEGRLVLAARVAPIRPGLVLVLVDDRTQARRVEEVRRDFVVNVSHELKTPVGGLALLAEAVQGAANDPEAIARFAGRMKTETERLTRLVSEIVDLSRLQASDLLADMTVVDVAACAEEAVDQAHLLAGNREVLAATAGDPARLRVYGDKDLITTAIRNLVTNAIAYSEDSTRVSVVTRRTGDLVEVAVTDQGRGISPTDQERIFERFYRVDAARSRSTGGTGLGLSIVKHICDNHGGDVTVWSQEGEGSTFTIRLPAADDDALPVGALAPHRPGQPSKVADPAHGDSPPSEASVASPSRKGRHA
ncbi:ATP-binding protein [Ornithinimicrobium humiphilum]|uniref:Sensor-like histidine kinase SenX3 n=1 Tax=Ornithinimicrobium humiphilum TaxID=125288 RepID=A0A543K7F3_9MICO|nr:ATP-binding protein [Ornithinimicrobium humiphilum]TQM91021.1 two-component system sensor histidine kinase SenX3 [Ornithinimicrobium humiphilum]